MFGNYKRAGWILRTTIGKDTFQGLTLMSSGWRRVALLVADRWRIPAFINYVFLLVRNYFQIEYRNFAKLKSFSVIAICAGVGPRWI